MSILKHEFTHKIVDILNGYSKNGEELLNSSEILQYLNIKTKAAVSGSKSRAGLANHYAIYVLVEDYIAGGFNDGKDYSDYEGAKYNDLFRRQRELPFGSKLQNHALNHRLNQEFRKYFYTCENLPIVRDGQTNRYWINEQLLVVNGVNVANAIIEIIEEYVRVRQIAFAEFMKYCRQIVDIQQESPEVAINFIRGLFQPNVDARVFEIASFAVLKQHYANQKIYWGWCPDALIEETLILYKTGRTNANDGGIDFVMKPLGRFFQVTETVDAGKFFLDIDKVESYPITFVVKTNESNDEIMDRIRDQAKTKYRIAAIVKRYMDSIEEVINVPRLMDIYQQVLDEGKSADVLDEIVLQSRVEFNVEGIDADIVSFGKPGKL